MRQIIDALSETRGKDVNIYINHKIFGEQHIKIRFVPETEIGFGFHCKGQVIYIDKNEIIDYNIKDDKIEIIGTMMSISIIKNILEE